MPARCAHGLALTLVLAACTGESGVGYVEIKTVPVLTAPALYLDAVRLEPMRNGTALLRHKVGTVKLQVDGEGGQLALLCNLAVQKDRITSVIVTVASRHLRCQCGRSGRDGPPNRTCVA
jgi:hypothetical protein